MGIVSWVFKMNEMEYLFERVTLEWMLKEAGHTIVQHISTILDLIHNQSLPTWAHVHPPTVIMYRSLCPFTLTSSLPYYLHPLL